MAFAVTADPARFDEASAWFRKRVVLTRDEAVRLGDDAGRRAFWIGGGLQLQQIQRDDQERHGRGTLDALDSTPDRITHTGWIPWGIAGKDIVPHRAAQESVILRFSKPHQHPDAFTGRGRPAFAHGPPLAQNPPVNPGA